VIGFIIPTYYSSLRTRYLYEKTLWDKIRENEYIIRITEIFYNM